MLYNDERGRTYKVCFEATSDRCLTIECLFVDMLK